jgi:DNA mismatch repair protein MutL
MVPRIRALPELVVNQIAAGEVIERPSSVVKELLENSVDAGATRIEIDVENGGHDLIRVVDDGCGIHPEDLLLAFAPHATSKLTSADELFEVGTFGFRGEALASVGSVAQVTLQSRPRALDAGSCIECHGGELGPLRAWSGAPGTRIEVRQLFFNTPVRRKFLKSPATEIGHISETVLRLALAHCRGEERAGLHLVLRHNGKVVHDIPASTGLRERIGLFFGRETERSLYEVRSEAGGARLHGYVADPACDRSNARAQYLFVNGRPVRDRSLSHAIQEAYRGLLMTGRYAAAFLFLELPPGQVDVNVHPTKSEVRFRHPQALHHLIYTAIKSRLREEDLVARLAPAPTSEMLSRPEAPPPEPLMFELSPPPRPAPLLPLPPAPTYRPRVEAPPIRPSSLARPERREAETPPPISEVLPTAAAQLPPARDEPRPWDVPRVIQLYDAYLVLETEEGMLVIDQHALHERILYEQYSKRIAERRLESQPLLIPEPVELSGEASGLLLEQKAALEELGLGVEPFEGSTVLLTRYPALLGSRSPSELLRAVADHLVEQEQLPGRGVVFNDILSLMACHSAVRAGERLSPEMMAELVSQRRLAEDHHHCPHGRPTALLFTRQELERQFRRV